jgi:hypothetical protein
MWKNNHIPKKWKIPQQSWIREINLFAVNKSHEAVYMFWNDTDTTYKGQMLLDIFYYTTMEAYILI